MGAISGKGAKGEGGGRVTPREGGGGRVNGNSPLQSNQCQVGVWGGQGRWGRGTR